MQRKDREETELTTHYKEH